MSLSEEWPRRPRHLNKKHDAADELRKEWKILTLNDDDDDDADDDGMTIQVHVRSAMPPRICKWTFCSRTHVELASQ